MEITMIIGIIVYFLNFFTGKTKNQKIANQVNNNNNNFLKEIEFQLSIVSGFLLTGLFLSPSSASLEMMATRYQNNRALPWAMIIDNVFQDMTEIQEPLTKESENLFSFWCSGR